MKKGLKSYAVFTPALYKGLMLVVLPLAATAFLIWCMRSMQSDRPGMVLIAFALLTAWYELGADYWAFAGICEKQAQSLEYVKTSPVGLTLLRRGILVDGYRRTVWLLGMAFVLVGFGGSLPEFASTAILTDFLVTLALTATRHFDMNALTHWGVSLLLSYGCAIAAALLQLLPQPVYFLGGIALAVADVLAHQLSAAHVVHCVKGEFYETEN